MSPYLITNRAHGIPFNRSGTCNRCPSTQPAPCCLGCPHFEVVTGVNTCLIYDSRDKKCTQCTKDQGHYVDHSECIVFPEHPWLWVIQQGLCAYQFMRLTESGEESNDPLPFIEVQP